MQNLDSYSSSIPGDVVGGELGPGSGVVEFVVHGGRLSCHLEHLRHSDSVRHKPQASSAKSLTHALRNPNPDIVISS